MSDLMHKAELQQLVVGAYRAVGSPAGAGATAYTGAQLAGLPPGAVEWSLGVGNPVAWADLRGGDVVLDLGCGGGIDTLLAAGSVGPSGRAIGLDLVPQMCARGRRHAAEGGSSTPASSAPRWRPSRCPATPSTRSSPTAW